MKTEDRRQARNRHILKDTEQINTVRYCGRDFTMEEMEVICKIVKTSGLGRTAISEKICEHFQWLKVDGKLKDMSCRVALLRMERDKWFKLPPALRRNGNGKQYKHCNRLKEGEPSINLPAGKIQELSLDIVRTPKQSQIWNEMIHRWHYLGYKKLVGSQLRYLINSSYGTLGALGFSASAWNVQAREEFIGWSRQVREQNLHLVVNNSRFLLLPWIKSKNLASKILSLVARKLLDDWEQRYKYRPVMLETFVEKKRFSGTCYKAANWIYVGETKGRGKLGDHSKLYENIKLIMVYPLCRKFRSTLQYSTILST
ncbi:MAG: DUF4338 domain-containing protein [Cytophagales bacterium]|nr:DUF4338 domain-containing protein [Cytophagales bacterium]